MKRLALLLLVGCSSSDSPTSVSVGACTGMLSTVADGGGQHVEIGTDVEWESNPPASGPHYPYWARWDREYKELDRRYWLHNVEHGGIVLAYNCPEGCDDVLEAFRARMRERIVDSACSAPIYNRMIITSDAKLPPDVKVAAVAWNVYYTDSCVDPYLETFVAQRYNQAPEDFCYEGVELGGTFVPQQ